MLESIDNSSAIKQEHSSASSGFGSNDKERIHARLMVASSNKKNDDAIACMLASSSVFDGAMPNRLGLSIADYNELISTHFPGVDINTNRGVDVDPERMDEQSELYELLICNAVDTSSEGKWIAQIVLTGCMGGNHLWQDMGLWSRDDLTMLMEKNFPELAKRNDKNMKWKKFLYKQLCIQEGIYTCRAPSCEVCVDYASCFAPE